MKLFFFFLQIIIFFFAARLRESNSILYNNVLFFAMYFMKDFCKRGTPRDAANILKNRKIKFESLSTCYTPEYKAIHFISTFTAQK